MNFPGWKVVVGQDDYAFSDSLNFRIYRWDRSALETLSIGEGGHFIGTRHENAEGKRWPEGVSLRVPMDILQALMDGLWEHGIRPKERRFENETKLLRGWLDDMRTLVFEGKGPLPKKEQA